MLKKIYSFLIIQLILIIVSPHSNIRKCGKPDIGSEPRILQSGSTTTIDATILSEEKRIQSGEQPQFRNIRITFDYQFFNISLVSSENYKIITESLMPSIKAYYQSFLKVYPRANKITPATFVCNNNKLKVNDESILNGYENTDLLVFLMGEYSNDPENNYLAWASSCNLDGSYLNRPIIGLLNMNFYYLNCFEKGWSSCFTTLVHELMHIIAFNSNLYDRYVNNDGTKIGINNVISTISVDSSQYKMMILPSIIELGKKYYKCDTLQGVLLENNENQPGAHWESVAFRDEIMSPIDRPYQKMSIFSFTLLNSTGWYIVDFSMVQDYVFGNGEGCDFLGQLCKKTPLFDEFCDSTTGTAICQENFIGVASCSINQFSDTCKTRDTYYTQLCINDDAINSNFSKIAKTQAGSLGPSSSCFVSNVNKPGNVFYQASCYENECVLKQGQLTINIYIKSLTSPLVCETTGQKLSVSGYSGQITCPSISEFCSYNSRRCPNNCNNGFGYCTINSKCIYLTGMNVCSNNCVSCQSNTICLICETGYYLQKTSLSSSCIKCSGECPLCPGGEYWSGSSKSCQLCDKSCLTCFGEGPSKCTSCQTPLIISEGKCIGCSDEDPNCKLCDTTKNPFICIGCVDGFYVDTNNKCNKCDISCKTCSGGLSSECVTCPSDAILKNNICTKCLKTQFVKNNICIDIDCFSLVGCAKCYYLTIDQLQCSECSNNFYLNEKQICQNCDKTCKTCSGPSEIQCNSCFDGFYYDNNQGKCMVCDLSCKSCVGLGPSKCSECAINYLININTNNCEKITCDSSCKDCTGISNNDCYSCFDGFYLNKPIDFTCKKCAVSCLTCTGSTEKECSSCKTNFVLIDNRCLDKSSFNIQDVLSIEGLRNFTNSKNIENIQNNIESISKLNSIVTSLNLIAAEDANIASLIILENSSKDKANNWDSNLILTGFNTIKLLSEKININSTISDPATISKNMINAVSNLKNLQESIVGKIQNDHLSIINKIIYNNFNTLTQNIKYLAISTDICNFLIQDITNLNYNEITIYGINRKCCDSPSIYLNSTIIKNLTTSQKIFIKVVEWLKNPFELIDVSKDKIQGDVVNFQFYEQKSSNSIIDNLLVSVNNSIEFKIPKPIGQKADANKTFICVYYNENENKWKSDGINSTIALQLDGSVICSTKHFSYFSYIFGDYVIKEINNTNNTTNNSSIGNFGFIVRINLNFMIILIIFLLNY